MNEDMPRDVRGATDGATPEPEDYKIGYRCPPRETQFKKGTSGNPGGKRKQPVKPDPKGCLTALLASPVPLRQDGRVRKVPVIEALYLTLIQAALSGDIKAMRELMRVIDRRNLDVPDKKETEWEALAAEVRAKIEKVADRLAAPDDETPVEQTAAA